ncbi:helix-turn-helix transcriptional regulator [Ornithinimicrobium tianjinense]|uniref:WYL domain-containing protein n=1 Tax=Ornithinimicrobium tianjinense TaxID=1195761 RepID=A0A917F534_9MICO|nr:WYL domain-containing protein [Ornithinimicrobium tianjinense]GGF47481.1 WYL domain-containing protein [Ornithinimicrobium tianjinense]
MAKARPQSSEPKGPSPAAAKTERLLNLVIALLATRQPLSKARIREAVPDYRSGNDEAFERMFERDKDELRALGIPLRTEPVDPFFDDELGYRIDEREYALPQIDLAPDEVAVVGLAARAWSQASLAGPAAQALRKLDAAGLVRDEASVAGIEPLLHTREPAFEPVRDAVLSRTPISFDYRGAGGAGLTTRRLEPWGLTSWHGRWYVTGHDLDREAPRVFRLDRMVGLPRTSGRRGGFTVPADHDPTAMIRRTYGDDAETTTTVRLLVREGAASSLRRRATPADHPAPAGWDALGLDVHGVTSVVPEICAAGPDVRVVDPPEVRDAVVAALTAVVRAHGGSPR